MPLKGGNAGDSFGVKYVLTCAAATVAETVTYPLDLTKTRLQLYGELSSASGAPSRKLGMISTASGIVKEEGFFRLWQGLTPAVYRHFIYSGCRMSIYEALRENLFGKSPDGSFPFFKAILCGMSAGALAQFLANPADLVKVQMQMEGKRRILGLPPRVRGVPDALIKIVREGGSTRALWIGWAPNVQRAALVNMGDLTSYDTAKHWLLKNTSLKDDFLTHGLSSLCSGLVAATLSTPADVIKTRIMNQPMINGKPSMYKSTVDCFIKTVRAEGFSALYKGFLPIWMRMAPWSTTFWITYEEIRSLSGVSSF